MNNIISRRSLATWATWLLWLALLPSSAWAHDVSGAAPQGQSRVIALAAGNGHACALRPDGSAQCWGRDELGQSTPPPGQRFMALAAGGGLHACGLRADGVVLCWGDDSVGQSTVPADETFAALAVGAGHSCGLRSDGSALCWGSDSDGQASAPAAQVFTALAAGSLHSCGLRADGSALCWGSDAGGQSSAPVGEHFIALSAGTLHTCGLHADGGALCWGSNASGQLAIPAGERFTALEAGDLNTCGLHAAGNVSCWGDGPVAQATVPAADRFVAIDLGTSQACGLRANGSLQCWGPDEAGVVHDRMKDMHRKSAAGTSNAKALLAEAGPFGFGAIGAGELHACQLRPGGNGTCWGYNDAGRATPPPGVFAKLGSGTDHNCALRDSGEAICWGDNRYGQSIAPAGALRWIESGDSYTCALGEVGDAGCWGWNSNGQGTPPPPPTDRTYRSIDAGFIHSCAVFDDNSGQCWGYEGDGQTLVPAGVWQAIRAGGRHSCGLRVDGTIACWGRNAEGQVGNVPNGTFKALATGFYHNCAIRQDGTLACWGLNDSAQSTPPPGTYVRLASGTLHNCAIRSDGVRKCWGFGSFGQAPDVELRPAVLPVAREGRAFSVQLLLRDVRDFYLPPAPGFALVEGALPPGLSFTASGLLSGTPTTPGSYAFTLEGEDGNGFAATRSYALEVLIPDLTPPLITPVVTGTLGDGDWYTGDVQVAWTVDDPDSDIESATGCDAVVLSTDSAAAGFTCTATSAGGTSSETVTIKRDATAPDTSLTSAPADPNGSPDATFVLAAQADVSGLAGYECSLDGAAFTACDATQSYQGLGDGLHTFAARAIDGAGNLDATPVTHAWTIDVDLDAPLIEPTVTGVLGDNGWYVGDVQVSWSVSDPHSPISETTGCNTTTLAIDTAGASFTCSATSLGGTASQTVTIKRDATAPVVTAAATTAANAAGWHRSDVTVQHACSDNLSGVVACPADQVLADEGTAVASSAVAVVDQAGNPSAPSNVVTVKLDKTAPTLTANVSPDLLLLNAGTVATANGSDALSGIGTQGCAALATGTVGSKTATCSAMDLAGNSATASADYRVVYGFAGFVAPLQGGASWNAAQTRRSIPFGWRVFDANNDAVTTLTAVTITRTAVACPGSPPPVPLASYGGSSTALRHLGAGNYRRDWIVSASFRGTCARMSIDLGDGIAHEAMFKFD